MKIHIADNIVYSDKEAYRRYRVDSGGLAESIATVDFTAYDMFDYVAPVVGADQKQTDVITIVDAGTRSHEVVDMTPQELADRLDKAQSQNRVNRYQIRMGLKEIGQLANVKSVYAALPTDDDIIILWSNDVDFARNGIFAMDMKTRFGLTDANLDNLWTKAAVYKS